MRFHVYRFILLKLRPVQAWLALVSLAVLIIGSFANLIGLTQHSATQSYLLWILVACSFVVFAFTFYNSFLRIPNADLDDDRVIFSYIPRINGAQRLPHTHEWFIMEDALNAWLRNHDFETTNHPTRYADLINKIRNDADVMEKALKCQMRKCLRFDPLKNFLMTKSYVWGQI